MMMMIMFINYLLKLHIKSYCGAAVSLYFTEPLCLLLKIELDKTAEEFRKAHSERQELLRQWENTIEQMQKRDREMDQLAVVCLDT